MNILQVVRVPPIWERSQPGEPSWKPLEQRAFQEAKTCLGKPSAWKAIEAAGLRGARERLIRELSPYDGALVQEVNADVFGHLVSRTHARLGILWEPGGRKSPSAEHFQLFLRLFDDFDRREKPDFAASWQWLLNEWNRWQFLPGLRVTSTSMLEEDMAFVEWVSEPLVVYEPLVDESPWVALAENAHSSAVSVLQALREHGVPLPEVGYEVMEGNRVVAELELAWPSQQVGLTLVEGEPVPAGWQVFSLGDYVSVIPCLEVEHA